MISIPPAQHGRVEMRCEQVRGSPGKVGRVVDEGLLWDVVSDGLHVDECPEEDDHVVGAEQGDDVLVKSTCFAVVERVLICEDPAEEEDDEGRFVVVVGVTEFFEERWSGVADDGSKLSVVITEDLGRAEDSKLEVVSLPERLDEGDHPDRDGTVACNEPEIDVLAGEVKDPGCVLFPREKTEEHRKEARRRGGVWVRLEPRRDGCVERLEKELEAGDWGWP